MLNRAQKEQAVSNLSEKISKSKGIFLVDYIGTDVENMTSLRKELINNKGEVQVVRNTLMRKALESHPEVQGVFSDLKGTNAFVFSYEDTPGIAKLLKSFFKKVETLKYKNGFLDGKAIDKTKMEFISSLPSKPEIQAKLLATFQAPMTQMVRVLNEVPRSMVGVLQNYKESKEK